MDTIFAVSSGAGRSAIAVVRVSGPASARVALDLGARALKPRRASLVTLRDPVSSEALDHALCIFFESPGSFTGEDSLELHLHGGRAVVHSVLAALAKIPGMRQAEPGEFTRRAFHNGKLGLDSAEALADLIQADTILQQRQALAALADGLGRIAADWREKLVTIQSMLEAWLDFPDESDVSDGLVEECQTLFVSLISDLESALRAGARSEILREGVKVLIAGPTNAGKSSLLNRLAQREAAIVAAMPGTTRDLIEVTLDIEGVPVTVLDGAGIRSTDDVVEQMGIDRVKMAARKANMIVWLSPAEDGAVEPPAWTVAPESELIRVVSKIDLARGCTAFQGVSMVTGEGVDELIADLGRRANRMLGSGEGHVSLRQRHYLAINELLECLRLGLTNVRAGRVELAVEDCRFALKAVARVSHPVHSEDVLDAVFRRFCIGK